ncbi:wax ester/triacylglycerol synthase family O-acyltransferase [Nocardia sp. NPDC055321]
MTSSDQTRVTTAPRQLGSMDLQLLHTETSTTPMHIGAITMLDSHGAKGGPLQVGQLRRLIASRISVSPQLRWRLRTVPLGVDVPYWEDCADLDLDHHIRDAPLSGTDLAEFVAELHAIPLERSRPLWECYLISGLPRGQQAIYIKVHHAVIDGTNGAEIMAALFDVDPEAQPESAPAAEIAPARTLGTVEMIARTIPNVLTRQLDRVLSLPRIAPSLFRMATGFRLPPNDLPFNRPNTAKRSYAFTSLPLADVKAIKNRHDATVNDVVMALCASALRRWLIAHAAPVERPLVAVLPISLRALEESSASNNEFSLMMCDLPIKESDPHHRMKLQRDELLSAKASFHSTPPSMLREATALLTPLLHGALTKAMLAAATPVLPMADILISNVAGPQFPLYVRGIPVAGCYPISLLMDVTGGLNITVMSFDGHLDFGILACTDVVPDVWSIAEYLNDALGELLDRE